MALLQVQNLSRRFGGVVAVDDVTLKVEDGEVLGLIGPNGAGKTTFFNLVTGYVEASHGEVTFRGNNITRLSASKRVRIGIARTFQTPQLFGGMSVRDNMLAGTYSARLSLQMLAANSSKRRAAEHIAQERCDRLLALVDMQSVQNVKAAGLAYGLQRKLEIARALMTEPRLLILDEPAAGMLPSEAASLNAMIRTIQKHGCTVMVVEHNMRVVMNVSDRIAVMDFGKIIGQGSPSEIRANPDVVRAYLGAASHA
jgi:branched-chain amino acid transport system ATP-binding protein